MKEAYWNLLYRLFNTMLFSFDACLSRYEFWAVSDHLPVSMRGKDSYQQQVIAISICRKTFRYVTEMVDQGRVNLMCVYMYLFMYVCMYKRGNFSLFDLNYGFSNCLKYIVWNVKYYSHSMSGIYLNLTTFFFLFCS